MFISHLQNPILILIIIIKSLLYKHDFMKQKYYMD